MGFWKDWMAFLSNNAKKNMKRFSITIGAFIFLVISSLNFPLEIFICIVYAGAVETSGIIIMSLFGKNGNGSEHNSLNSIETTETKESNETKEPIILNEQKEKIPI